MSDASIEEHWRGGQRCLIVKIPVPVPEKGSTPATSFEVGLISDTCLRVVICGESSDLELPWPVSDTGPSAGATLLRRHGQLIVTLPEYEHPEHDKPLLRDVANLAFQDLSAHEMVEIEGRATCEGRFMLDSTVRQNLFWLRGLLTVDEISCFFEAAKAEGVAWDNASADSVDGFPVFETYLVHSGTRRGGKLSSLLTPIAQLLTTYVRRRYSCSTAMMCHALLRRYLPEERRAHPTHFDSHAFVTVVVALNPEDYQGGLYVQDQPGLQSRQYPLLKKGDILVHSYDLLHGVRVFEGVRYSLIFWFVDSPEACKTNSSPWYFNAAKLGDAVAQYNLGSNFHHGKRGCPQDRDQAEQFYKRSAEQGNCMALNALGRLHEERNQEAEAKRLYELAASSGSSTAMLNLARLASCEEPANDEAAVQWLKAAAAEDSVEAVCALGKMYAQGRGVLLNYTTAMDLFRQGADRGHPEAQFAYGLALEQGWSGQADIDAAALWYYCAMRQGSSKAADCLKSLEAAGQLKSDRRS